MTDRNEEIRNYNTNKLAHSMNNFFGSLSMGKYLLIQKQAKEMLNTCQIDDNKKYPFAYNYTEWTKKELSYTKDLYQRLKDRYGMKTIRVKEYQEEAIKLLEEMKIEPNFADMLITQTHMKHIVAYNWDLYKQVYKFNEEFLEMVTNDSGYEKVPTQILKNLPFDTFAIENNITIDNIKIKNIFITKTKTEDTESDCILFHYIMDTKDYDYFFIVVPLEDVDQVIDDVFKIENQYGEDFIKVLKHTLPLLVYLCSSNKEVRYIEKKNGTEKNRSKYTKKQNIEVYDVGYEIGASIKATKVKYVNGNEKPHTSGMGTPKRPHTRSGHFHSFWVGSREEGNRQLIVKYIPPIFVKGGNLKPIVHNVKG